jgi:hypothetical protein
MIVINTFSLPWVRSAGRIGFAHAKEPSSLAEYLDSRGVAFQPFVSLGTVADFLMGRHGAATAWRREPRRAHSGAAPRALVEGLSGDS